MGKLNTWAHGQHSWWSGAYSLGRRYQQRRCLEGQKFFASSTLAGCLGAGRSPSTRYFRSCRWNFAVIPKSVAGTRTRNSLSSAGHDAHLRRFDLLSPRAMVPTWAPGYRGALGSTICNLLLRDPEELVAAKFALRRCAMCHRSCVVPMSSVCFVAATTLSIETSWWWTCSKNNDLDVLLILA